MKKWIGLIDATHHQPDASASRVVAGLSLLARAVRLAAASECSHAIIAATDEQIDRLDALVATMDVDIDLLTRRVSSSRLGTVLCEISSAIEPLLAASSGVLYLRSSTVYDRALIHAHDNADGSGGGLPYRVGLVEAEHGNLADIFEVGAQSWPNLIDECTKRSPPATTIGDLTSTADTIPSVAGAWQVRVTDTDSAGHAAARLWGACRKSADGVVSRYLNRHLSLSISRSIAATGIHPNHISIVTFMLGALAAVFAGIGGYVWFALAGVTYQLNSIIDGVDGELARVKYEFSLLGEWLDTLSDDTKDVLFYGGLAVGAWRGAGAPLAGLDASVWLWLGGIAVGGKLISMLAYYTWLIAHHRGDLLAFEWSFEDEPAQPSAVSTALATLKYATKNDFVVFAAMLMALAGVLPYFLVAVAPGQLVIATSVIFERIK